PGSGACTLFSHRATYSFHVGGSHGMNLAMAGVMHAKTSGASVIWNWLSCSLEDWMTIMVLEDYAQARSGGVKECHEEFAIVRRRRLKLPTIRTSHLLYK